MSPFPAFQVQLELRVSVQLLRPPSSAALSNLVLVAGTGQGHLTPLEWPQGNTQKQGR